MWQKFKKRSWGFMPVELIHEWLNNRFESVQVDLLRRLVDQPSCSRETDDVEAAQLIMDEVAQSLGLSIEVIPDPTHKHASHRVYRNPPSLPSTPSLALVGHIDTVFPRSMGFFGFTRDGDVAKGPGVLDMKSGLCMILCAVAILKEQFPSEYARIPITLVVVSDEEVGSTSSRALYAKLAPTLSQALVFEAGRDQNLLVSRRRGGGLYEITARGVAAHSGNEHDKGVNAIHALARIIPAIEALSDYDKGRLLNVGIVQGGTSKNTVPAWATIGVDTRYEQLEDATFTDLELKKLISTWSSQPLPLRLDQIKWTLSGGVTRPPMTELNGVDAMIATYQHAAQLVGFVSGKAPLQGGGSDGNLLTSMGVPTLDGLGPYGKFFHDTKEWCSLSSLKEKTAALTLYLLEQVQDQDTSRA